MLPDIKISSASDSDAESIFQYNDTQTKLKKSCIGQKYTCTVSNCNATFKRLDQLDRHEFHHTGIKKHTCTYENCDKTYSILTHLKRHIRTAHERIKDSNKNVPCSIEGCMKLFQTSANMRRHIREIHENPKVYNCSYCGEKYTQKLKMRRHIIQIHTGEYPHNCTKCGKGFYQQWNFDRHISVCKVYVCQICSVNFEKWSLYVKHCKETQHGRKYYKCDYCDRIYGKPSDLQRHVGVKHLNAEQKQNYKCSYENCDRKYVYERNLKHHILTAHQGKRFDCKELNCQRFFSSTQNLLKHIERDHNNVLQTIEKKCKVGERKKRKDAGTPKMSAIAKLSGLAVNKSVDKLLKIREGYALNTVSALLRQDVTLNEECELEQFTRSNDQY